MDRDTQSGQRGTSLETAIEFTDDEVAEEDFDDWQDWEDVDESGCLDTHTHVSDQPFRAHNHALLEPTAIQHNTTLGQQPVHTFLESTTYHDSHLPRIFEAVPAHSRAHQPAPFSSSHGHQEPVDARMLREQGYQACSPSTGFPRNSFGQTYDTAKMWHSPQAPTPSPLSDPNTPGHEHDLYSEFHGFPDDPRSPVLHDPAATSPHISHSGENNDEDMAGLTEYDEANVHLAGDQRLEDDASIHSDAPSIDAPGPQGVGEDAEPGAEDAAEPFSENECDDNPSDDAVGWKLGTHLGHKLADKSAPMRPFRFDHRRFKVTRTRLRQLQSHPAYRKLPRRLRRFIQCGQIPVATRDGSRLHGRVREPECPFPGYGRLWDEALAIALELVDTLCYQGGTAPRHCRLSMFKLEAIRWLSGMITFEVARLLGYDGPPGDIPALWEFFDGVKGLKLARLFSAGWMGQTAHNAQTAIYLSCVPIGTLCPRCSSFHDKLRLVEVLQCGIGQLEPERIDALLRYGMIHVSHLCHKASCNNPRHIVIEPAGVNNLRMACQSGVQTECDHDPPCLMTAHPQAEQDFYARQNKKTASVDAAPLANKSNSAPGTPLEEQGAASIGSPDEDGDYQDDTLPVSSGDMTDADSLHSGDSVGGVDDPDDNDVQETTAKWVDNFMQVRPCPYPGCDVEGRHLVIHDHILRHHLQERVPDSLRVPLTQACPHCGLRISDTFTAATRFVQWWMFHFMHFAFFGKCPRKGDYTYNPPRFPEAWNFHVNWVPAAYGVVAETSPDIVDVNRHFRMLITRRGYSTADIQRYFKLP
ncbi:unnamed protein product [Zymoseptoria tritici ST99CH_1E4]|uniref:Zinc-binding loop region of homing endonuclease domain-containing protein n=1 Tax=Zymoseptoria tritici ST99CH_1E4 TaxID=1276532 RepID=A0A2H1G4J6_ZYMTR|nr:unnamed protein product [Zymoseptoria tritici ST99CH_1E4]